MKRSFDVIMSFIVIGLFFPLMIFFAIVIKISSSGPILFSSNRVGKNNKIFKMYKFRTMQNNTPLVATHLLKDSNKYITHFGLFLRQSSLDELPQLWNIIKGEMSLVGPRPALFNQCDLIEIRTKFNIHKLQPGLTGWAQVNGRDELPILAKVKFDVEYLEKNNLFFDIKIIFLTFLKVLMRTGIKNL